MMSKLHTDPGDVIELVLNTLDRKIIADLSITKTQRTRLFNETTVPQILECYNSNYALPKKSLKTAKTTKKEQVC